MLISEKTTENFERRRQARLEIKPGTSRLKAMSAKLLHHWLESGEIGKSDIKLEKQQRNFVACSFVCLSIHVFLFLFIYSFILNERVFAYARLGRFNVSLALVTDD